MVDGQGGIGSASPGPPFAVSLSPLYEEGMGTGWQERRYKPIDAKHQDHRAYEGNRGGLCGSRSAFARRGAAVRARPSHRCQRSDGLQFPARGRREHRADDHADPRRILGGVEGAPAHPPGNPDRLKCARQYDPVRNARSDLYSCPSSHSRKSRSRSLSAMGGEGRLQTCQMAASTPAAHAPANTFATRSI
ncbi:hypothetical protein IQ26_06641 [Mesorhizobium tianshanense]|uniref:Uncharacterized protein n=1 Tax=Mesorhizobium tianshanense TaxID=39844 RepID=A0A562MRU3_9HYPH|nr:hypothetical protein IQ26_06641 [Mesorhizobium tianshanense]